MRTLSAAELLEIWEGALTQPVSKRAEILLSAAYPELQADSLAHLRIGQRDALLIKLRQMTFGSRVSGVANCPQCQEQVEMDFMIEEICIPNEHELRGEPPHISVEGFDVQFRLPDTLDLVAASGATEPADLRNLLLERCLMTAKKENKDVSFDMLPTTVLEAIEGQMSKLDPQADVRLHLTCPNCHQTWSSAFDILSFFWTELNAWAQRVLAEVHALALAYGWRETDILKMSPTRRNLYLSMVNG